MQVLELDLQHFGMVQQSQLNQKQNYGGQMETIDPLHLLEQEQLVFLQDIQDLIVTVLIPLRVALVIMELLALH